MENRNFFRSRTVAIVAGAALLVTLGGVGGAVGAKLVTSADIKDQTIKKVDIAKNGVGGSEVKDRSLKVKDLSNDARTKLKGNSGPAGARGPQGPSGPAGPPGTGATYQGANWSIIDRNTIGNGDAYLRAGPSAGPTVKPPAGVGSLGLRTGSGADKAAFGNQVDFVGDALSGVDAVSFWVFTTGENRTVSPENLPNVTVEIDPDSTSDAAPNFSSLVFAPADAPANAWSEIDASTAERWWLTGDAGTNTGCTQADFCTLDQVQTALSNASVLSVAIGKGRDSAFSGAVDKLVWNTTTYDFEPFGVSASN